MKEEYRKPRIDILELMTESVLCDSLIKDGATIGGVTKDDDYEW